MKVYQLFAILIIIWCVGLIGAPVTLTTSVADETTDTNTVVGPQSDAEISGSPYWREYLSGRKQVRVGLVKDVSKITITGSGKFCTSTSELSPRTCLSGEVVTFEEITPNPVRLIPESKKSIWTVTVDGKSLSGKYNGNMEIFTSPAASANISSNSKPQLILVNETSFETYIAGVVAREEPDNFQIEAQRAQAIAARSYTLRYLTRHQSEGFDLCATTHCHVYRGVVDPLCRAYAATYSTRGQILIYKDEPIKALYSSICGGETASGRTLSIDPEGCPYLRGIVDAPDAGGMTCSEDDITKLLKEPSKNYCRIANNNKNRWQVSFTTDEISDLVKTNIGRVMHDANLKPGKVKNMKVESRIGGRVDKLKVKCDNGTYHIKGNEIRWLLGSKIHSTYFLLSVDKNGRGNPKEYTFMGAGWGHGVGMCQWGAEGRARQGQSAREILAAYYSGTELWTEKLIQESEE